MIWPASLLLFASLIPGAGFAADGVTFRIHDHRDPAEIDETTGVYVDGREVATFHLGPERDDDVAVVSVAGPDGHTYSLCGRITVREADGSAVLREVNGAGRISDVTDRDFDAVAANDFTVFYLRDMTTGRPPAPVSVEPRRGCAAHISAR